eukprot:gene24862-10521_t
MPPGGVAGVGTRGDPSGETPAPHIAHWRIKYGRIRTITDPGAGVSLQGVQAQASAGHATQRNRSSEGTKINLKDVSNDGSRHSNGLRPRPSKDTSSRGPRVLHKMESKVEGRHGFVESSQVSSKSMTGLPDTANGDRTTGGSSHRGLIAKPSRDLSRASITAVEGRKGFVASQRQSFKQSKRSSSTDVGRRKSGTNEGEGTTDEGSHPDPSEDLVAHHAALVRHLEMNYSVPARRTSQAAYNLGDEDEDEDDEKGDDANVGGGVPHSTRNSAYKPPPETVTNPASVVA